jgi:hypothetical protein
MGEPHTGPDEDAGVVGSPMVHEIVHPAEQGIVDRLCSVSVEQPCNPAHALAPD